MNNWTYIFEAIERCTIKRASKGASKKSILEWLKHLKTIHKNEYQHTDINKIALRIIFES